MAGEAQHIRAKVDIPGKSSERYTPMITLETICNWIRKQGLDEYTTHGLIELAGRYPNKALPSFRKNFNLMIQRVRQKRKQEVVEYKAQDIVVIKVPEKKINANRTKIQLDELEDNTNSG